MSAVIQDALCTVREHKVDNETVQIRTAAIHALPLNRFNRTKNSGNGVYVPENIVLEDVEGLTDNTPARVWSIDGLNSVTLVIQCATCEQDLGGESNEDCCGWARREFRRDQTND